MGYIQQALLLLMKDKAYPDITIGEITAKAGVNRSTYYRHFDTKESIIHSYLDSIMETYQKRFQQLHSQDFTLYLRTMFETFYENKENLTHIHQSGLPGLPIRARPAFGARRQIVHESAAIDLRGSRRPADNGITGVFFPDAGKRPVRGAQFRQGEEVAVDVSVHALQNVADDFWSVHIAPQCTKAVKVNWISFHTSPCFWNTSVVVKWWVVGWPPSSRP